MSIPGETPLDRAQIKRELIERELIERELNKCPDFQLYSVIKSGKGSGTNETPADANSKLQALARVDEFHRTCSASVCWFLV